jgi:putative sigma-54 modulation protein
MSGRYSVEIKFATRHGHVSDDTQAKIAAKLERLSRLYDRITSIEVTINLEHRDLPDLDVRVSVEHRDDFVAASQSEDLLASTDDVVRKLEQQLRKYKEKVVDRHRTAAHKQVEGTSDLRPATE